MGLKFVKTLRSISFYNFRTVEMNFLQWIDGNKDISNIGLEVKEYYFKLKSIVENEIKDGGKNETKNFLSATVIMTTN